MAIYQTSKRAIITPRLTLLPSSDERDLAEYKAHLTNPDEFFLQYGIHLTNEILNLVDFHSSGVSYYTVFLNKTKKMIGYVGIKPHGLQGTEGELEFHIFKEHRNNGYCTEACAVLLETYFTGHLEDCDGKTAVAETMPENAATCRVLEKLGFVISASVTKVSLNESCEINPDLSYLIDKYKLPKGQLNAECVPPFTIIFNVSDIQEWLQNTEFVQPYILETYKELEEELEEFGDKKGAQSEHIPILRL